MMHPNKTYGEINHIKVEYVSVSCVLITNPLIKLDIKSWILIESNFFPMHGRSAPQHNLKASSCLNKFRHSFFFLFRKRAEVSHFITETTAFTATKQNRKRITSRFTH